MSKNYIISILFILLFLNTYTFRVISFNNNLSTEKNIEALFKNEKNNINPFEYSKYLTDLEKLNLISCSILDSSNKMSFFNSCLSKANLNFFSKKEFSLKSLSGHEFKITYYKPINWNLILLEFLIDLILVTTSIALYFQIQKNILALNSKLKILELDNNLKNEINKQVTHDIASPISSLKMMISLIKDVDPEIKEIMNSAIDRTFSIFNTLKEPQQFELESVDLRKIIQEIVNEKYILLKKNDIDLTINIIDDEKIKYLISNKLELSRIISNILNNSIESVIFLKIKKININVYKFYKSYNLEIIDNGIGIPEDILIQLGSKKISFGKENHIESGSGIGLYTAFQKVKLWGGSINIKSKKNHGTQVTLTFPG